MAPRTFTVATTVEDPMTAERLVDALQTANFDAFTRVGGAASSAAFASAQPAFYDVLVESESFDKAAALIAAFLEEEEKDSDANAKAAEEESQSTEPPVA